MLNHTLSITLYLTSILLFIMAILGFAYGSESLFYERTLIVGIALGITSDMKAFARVLLKPVRQLIFAWQLYQMSTCNIHKVKN